MRRKIAIVAALAATIVGAAACGTDTPTPTTNNDLNGEGKTIKVWLMVDAESSWKNVVDDASARFTAATKAKVNVEYQQWANRYTRLDTALAGSRGARRGRARQHRHAEVRLRRRVRRDRQVPSSRTPSTWLKGLSDPCTLDGKVYCVPYYAGARVLIYRTDLLNKAGLKPPTTYAELLAAADKLKADNAADPNFAAFYMPGAYWYAAMSWVYGEGGQIATKGSRRQVGRRPGAAAGAGRSAEVGRPAARSTRKGDPTKDENDQDAIFAQGHAAFLYGNGWELGAVQSQQKDPNDPNSPMVDTAVKGKVAAVALPGAAAGTGLPSFLGGSAIAVTGEEQGEGAGPGVGQVLHRHQGPAGSDRQGCAAQRDRAARQGRRGHGQRGHRARREEQLVRADGAEVGRRGEQQRPAADAA